MSRKMSNRETYERRGALRGIVAAVRVEMAPSADWMVWTEDEAELRHTGGVYLVEAFDNSKA